LDLFKHGSEEVFKAKDIDPQHMMQALPQIQALEGSHAMTIWDHSYNRSLT
jgi:hypothetical protein